MSKLLSPGTKAPEFTLPVTPDQDLSLADLSGRPVVLCFYPVGTPTFFINGRRHDGSFSYESLAAAIYAELRESAHAP